MRGALRGLVVFAGFALAFFALRAALAVNPVGFSGGRAVSPTAVPWSILPVPASGSAAGSTSAPTTTSATYVVIPEMTTTMTTHGGVVVVSFTGSFDLQSGDSFAVSIFEDGNQVTASELSVQFFGGSLLGLTPAEYQAAPVTCQARIASSAGSHTYDARWKRSAGTARAITTQRQLIAAEIG